jgi:hypothetical protein
MNAAGKRQPIDIDDGRLGTVQQIPDQVAADETGAAGHQNACWPFLVDGHCPLLSVVRLAGIAAPEGHYLLILQGVSQVTVSSVLEFFR